MQQTSSPSSAEQQPGAKTTDSANQLGPLLCWAVVFADIGTSIYYVPGILYGTVGARAGFFVLLTTLVFILLTFKYTEVTYRFPQGGGVVTVAANALNRWFGALGGMFILVDYFLTAAISCLSGILYLSVVVPAIGPRSTLLSLSIALWITLGALILLGILNWLGVSESARVSMVAAVIAFVSDVAILVTVFTHLSFSQFLGLFPLMARGHPLTPVTFLAGFAGSFLAFSGLESISQLSPVMKQPRRLVGRIGLLLVVVTVGITSPLLTILSTLLLPHAAADPVLSAQIISLLGGRWGGAFLQTEVAISAGALLVFASNTAIIGSYHVFLALSRMEFFPEVLLQRNKLRGTPHYAILLATGIPILVLLLVRGNINVLGDMYAFGLLGAFALTCLGMDIVRIRDRRARRNQATLSPHARQPGATTHNIARETGVQVPSASLDEDKAKAKPYLPQETALPTEVPEPPGPWSRSSINFWLGILTTVLVITAWSTNLVNKPLATAFGGSVAAIGMVIAYVSTVYHRRRGRLPVLTTGIQQPLPDAILAVMTEKSTHNDAVINAAISNADKHPIVFLYVGHYPTDLKPRLFRLIEPHLNDLRARDLFARANHLANEARITSRFIYRQDTSNAIKRVWQAIHPIDTILPAEEVPAEERLPADRTSPQNTPHGGVVHLKKFS